LNELPQPPQPMPGRLPVASGEFALPAIYAGAFTGTTEGQESFLRQYWRIFYKRRLIILAITAFCVALGILMAMLTQREYAATVTLEVARETSKVLTNIEGVEQDADTLGYGDEFYQTQYALLKSRSLSEAVARDLKLADNYLFLAGFEPDKADEYKTIPRDERFSIASSIVNANTIIAPIRFSSIINVRYNSPNPAMAATIANSIAENFVQSNLTRRFEAAAYARQFLQNRLNQVRAKLEESERKAVAYAQDQGIIKLKSGEGKDAPEQSLIANQLGELSGQLSIARAQRAQAEAQYRAGTSGSIAAQQLVNPAVNALRQQRAELQGQLSKLQSDFGPEYPQVVALRSQIAELDRQIGIEQGRVSSGVSQDMGGKYRQALAAENAIQSRVDALKSQLLGEEGRSIQYNIIQRDVDTNRALYEALLQRFKEVGVAGGIGTNNISIIDRALPPGAPFKPNLRLNIIVGLFMGLLLGALTAFVLEQLEEAAVLPADFQRKFGIPLLGATPKLSDPGRVQEALLESKSPLSEAYFSILTSVQFSTAHGTPSSFMLTSAQAREGKSTTAVALAQALTGVGAKVLLIDADMRNPSLHKILGRSLGNGLSNLLTGSGTLDEVTQPSQTPNLSVIMAGHIPPNPAELLSTEAIDRIIAEATSKYDHVVVDGPPILGLADAPLLTRSVEATVLVVESGRTRATQARHAIDRLLAVRANVIGAVLSKFDVQNSGYGYGYGYGYDYDYAYSYGR
jgi:succinoglycan biosynthesis transport protein ExoP